MQFKEILEGIDLWLAVLWLLLVVGTLVGIIAFLVKAFPIVRKLIAFLNDVGGEEARPGFPARPGLFDRIHSIELLQASMSDKLDNVHHELFPNSGKSLRDQTNRIEAKVSADYREISRLKEQVGELSVKVETATDAVTTVAANLDEHIEVSAGILNNLNKE